MEAVRLYDLSLAINPNYDLAYSKKGINIIFFQGESLHFLGKFNEAIKLYDKALEINPHHASTYFNKG